MQVLLYINIFYDHLIDKREWVKDVMSLHTAVVILSDLTYLKSFKAIQDKQLVFQPKDKKKKKKTERETERS